MNEKMRAVTVNNGNIFSYDMVDKPIAGIGEIILRIEAAGICAADRKIFSGKHPWELPDPYFPGHEYVGTVVELGTGASAAIGLKLGDRATAEILVPCWECWFCRRGLYHHCDQPGVCVGAWAEFLKIPKGALIHQVPTDLPAREAVLIEPLSCSIHAVNLARIKMEDTVVVSGLGAIGMGVLQVARLRNPHTLIGLDVNEHLLAKASELGANYTQNPLEGDAPEMIRDLTGGRGADIYIEASGAPASIHMGIESLRKAGRLVVFGVYAENISIDFNQISEFKELELLGGHLSPNAYPLAIKYLTEGLIDASVMVTDEFPLSEYEAAIRVKDRMNPPSIKTILIPENVNAG